MAAASVGANVRASRSPATHSHTTASSLILAHSLRQRLMSPCSYPLQSLRAACHCHGATGDGPGDARSRCDIDRPAAVFDYLRLRLSALEHEVFAVLYLDAQNRLIAYEELFRGTVSQTAVYPREIVKRALAHNASAVVLAHNHPSGLAEPSSADRLLTDSLKRALQFVGTTVLDHIIVAGPRRYSFAEHGLI